MNRKLYIKTMGCQMNEYDSDKMADVLRESHGFELTDKVEEADLLLVNTCSIREKAQEKVFSELGRWRPLKKARPGVMIDRAGECRDGHRHGRYHARSGRTSYTRQTREHGIHPIIVGL